jgi:hypothetical protein
MRAICKIKLLRIPGVSESSRARSKKKCWLNFLNFGCHLLQNRERIQRALRIFHSSKAPWKSFSLMLSSTACDSLWMSDTVSKRRHFTFIFNLGNKAKSLGAKSGKYGGWGSITSSSLVTISVVFRDV